MKPLFDLGILPIRHKTHKGYKPHISLVFNADRKHIFSIDTTYHNCQPDAYLVTHAHSDHHGKSTMTSERAVCSKETAHALEILYGKEYAGKSFNIGDTIDICGVKVRTFPTFHTIGSCAFYWENEVGTRILVTGDVNYSALKVSELVPEVLKDVQTPRQ